ncbi:hypothetical protein [Microbacterium sp.]|uniref:hypothetical protein n=1 Tax=Microbacterium sp. TaxID=51671 RepID=UPI003A929BA8
MAKVIVRAPGKVSRRIAGVTFSEGRAEVDTESAAFQFFRRHSYEVEGEHDAGGESLVVDAGTEDDEQSDDDRPDDDGAADGGADESDDDEQSDDVQGESEQSERPHPVQGSKAAWYEHLEKLNPKHGFDLETVKRAELIAAVEAIESKQG